MLHQTTLKAALAKLITLLLLITQTASALDYSGVIADLNHHKLAASGIAKRANTVGTASCAEFILGTGPMWFVTLYPFFFTLQVPFVDTGDLHRIGS
jgi:hypothetical protein